MIDPDLARRARTYERPVAPLKVFPRIEMVGPVSLVTMAEAADAAVAALSALGPAWCGLDTEYQAVARPDRPAHPDDWRDPSRVEPISVGVAAFVQTGDVLTVHRVAFDVRCRATHAALARLLALPTVFAAHNFRAELFAVSALGLVFPERVFCTWLAAKLLDLGRHHRHYENPAPVTESDEIRAGELAEQKRESGVSLLGLLRRHGLPYRFGGDKAAMQARYHQFAAAEPLSELDAAYVAADAEAAGALYPRLRAALDAHRLTQHYEAVEMPSARAFAAMQLRGVRIDGRRRELALRAAARAVACAEQDLEGYGFPVIDKPVRRVLVNSRPALLRALEARGLLHLFRSSKAASGYAVTRERLKELREAHPLLDALYRHRRFGRVTGDRLFLGGHIGADGRVHCEIDPLGTGTGRPAYKRPNLVGLGAEFRPIVIPDVGYGLTELDFVAQEIFIAAVVFGDVVLLADVNEGDPYRRVVGWLFPGQLPPGHELLTDKQFAEHPVCKPLRKRAKILTLGIIYGMGDGTVAAKLGVKDARARLLRDRFFERYTGLRAGMARAVRLLEERGYAETLTGAKRFRGASGPLSRWEERWAVNTPVQGTAASVLKVLMARLEGLLTALDAGVVLAPYDAVLIQHPLDERGGRAIDLTTNSMLEVMREIVPGSVPRVDVNNADPSCWNDEGRSDSIERFILALEARS